MKTATFNTAWPHRLAWARGLAWASLAAGVWAWSAGAAQARDGRDVYWSIGVNQPGVSVGVSNTAPVVIGPRAPVLLVERPVVYERSRVVQNPWVVRQPPVVVYETRPYVQDRPVVVDRDRGQRWAHERGNHPHKKWRKRHNRHGGHPDRHHD